MNTSQPLLRTFICIEFPESVVKEVARIQSLLDKKFIGKFTELENLHLTLKFLGEISPKQLEEVKLALSLIEFHQFNAHLSSIGVFSYRTNPRIIWIKVASKYIHDLQKRIDHALAPLFKPEERFMSHLTVARVKHTPDKKYFYEYFKNLSVKEVSFPVNSFLLKSSELMPVGPVYTTIQEYSLKEN